ncbi:hypothetical protein BH24ACT7_BH24ACT7_03410 [soil metagenome]
MRIRRRGTFILCLLIMMPACSGAPLTTPQDVEYLHAAEYAAAVDEHLLATAACLTATGWPAEVDTEEDSLDVDMRGSVREAFRQALAACEAEVGPPPEEEPLDEAGIRQFYEELIDAKACLERQGLVISDPPSVETFIDQWASGPWHPYTEIPDESWEAALAACPQPGT